MKPDYAQVYNNMGNALKENGELEEAIASYNKALALKPDYADAFNNMGIALQQHGKLDEAIEAFKKALSFKLDYAEASYNIGNAIEGVTFKQPNPDLQKIIISLLDKKQSSGPRILLLPL